ncbi:PAS domain-containing protein [Baekduia alba]|uniref:PAS domain-containing protein n=1 Tax=Baekduia alba TaxID=2997333 RepID=UPI002340E437|nr:PAS domain-containing protein [Baekduia alba]
MDGAGAGGPGFLEEALEELAEPATIVGPDGLVRSNRAARALHGLPRQPLTQEDWAARHRVFAPGSGRALALDELPLIRALRDEEDASIDVEVDTADAGRDRFTASGRPVRRGRHVVGALCVLRSAPPPADATDPALHPELLRHAADGIAVICAATGTFVYTNDAWTNALGYAPGDLAGRHVSSVNAPSGRVPQEIAGEMLEVLDRGEVWRGEVELRRRDGAVVWWEQTVSRYEDEDGRPAWIIVGRDATARRAAMTELGEGERRFHAAFDALPAAAAICDEDGCVLAVNDALVALARASREALLGRALEAVLPPVDLDVARALAESGRRGDIARHRHDARCAGALVAVTTTVVRQVDGQFQEAVVLVEPGQPSSTS